MPAANAANRCRTHPRTLCRGCCSSSDSAALSTNPDAGGYAAHEFGGGTLESRIVTLPDGPAAVLDPERLFAGLARSLS